MGNGRLIIKAFFSAVQEKHKKVCKRAKLVPELESVEKVKRRGGKRQHRNCRAPTEYENLGEAAGQ